MYLSKVMTINVTYEQIEKIRVITKPRKVTQQFGTPAACVAKPNV
jgi:hypothetical protein